MVTHNNWPIQDWPCAELAEQASKDQRISPKFANRRFRLAGAFGYIWRSSTNSNPTLVPLPMAETDSHKQKPSLWRRFRPYAILIGVVLTLEAAVAYALDWSLFHVNEVEMSPLLDGGNCLKFTINNLLQEERVVEQPTLLVMSYGSQSVARSRPMPLKFDGTTDDRILLQPGDKLRLCVKFTSDTFKHDLGQKLQGFQDQDTTQCRFTVIVRKPERSHAHAYSRVFKCASRLTSLYQ